MNNWNTFRNMIGIILMNHACRFSNHVQIYQAKTQFTSLLVECVKKLSIAKKRHFKKEFVMSKENEK